MKFLRKLFSREPKKNHIWKTIRLESLDSYTDYGNSPYEITTMYKIAKHQECLLTGEKQIVVYNDFFPVEERE
jgi:hypothetical protein